MSERMEIEHFAPHEGSTFQLQNGSEAGYELDLIEVKSLKCEDDDRNRLGLGIHFQPTEHLISIAVWQMVIEQNGTWTTLQRRLESLNSVERPDDRVTISFQL